MKKSLVFGISFILFFWMMSLVSAIRINEIELNPEGADSRKEWIELYSENEVNLINFEIKNNDNKSIKLNESFSGYFIINLKSQWLDNSDEKVYLYDNKTLIDSSEIFSDSANDNRTWQYCSKGWIFVSSTKNSENLCEEEKILQNTTTENKTEIYLKLDYDEEIANGEEFEAEIKAYNLKEENYDIKIYIEDEEKIISENYYEENNTWKSGNYYIEKFFDKSGNQSKNIKLRIKEEYSNFTGKAKIIAKIRLNGESSVLNEIEDNIKIKEKEQTQAESSESNIEKAEEETTTENQTNTKIIKLNNPKDIKTEEINKVYKSKTQYIREYAIYGFALFCVFIIMLLLKRKII